MTLSHPNTPEMGHEEKQQLTAGFPSPAHTRSSSTSSEAARLHKADRILEKERERLLAKKLAVERAKEKQRQKREDDKKRQRLKRDGGALAPSPPANAVLQSLPSSQAQGDGLASGDDGHVRAERQRLDNAELRRRADAQEALRAALEAEITQLKEERRKMEEETARKKIELEQRLLREAEARVEHERLVMIAARAGEEQRRDAERRAAEHRQHEERRRVAAQREAEETARKQAQEDRQRLAAQQVAEQMARRKAQEEQERMATRQREKAREDAQKMKEAVRTPASAASLLLPTFTVQPREGPPSSREEADLLAQRLNDAVRTALEPIKERRRVRVVRDAERAEEPDFLVAARGSLATVPLPSFAASTGAADITSSPAEDRRPSSASRSDHGESDAEDDTGSVLSYTSHLSTRSAPVRKARRRWTAPVSSSLTPTTGPQAPTLAPLAPPPSSSAGGTALWSIPLHPLSVHEQRLAERKRSALLASQVRRSSLRVSTKDLPGNASSSTINSSHAPVSDAPAALPPALADAQRWAASVRSAAPHTVDDSYAAQYTAAIDRGARRTAPNRRSTMPVMVTSTSAPHSRVSPLPGPSMAAASSSASLSPSHPSSTVTTAFSSPERRSPHGPSGPLKPRSNRQQLITAVTFTLLSSPVHSATRLSVLRTLTQCPGSHFLLLLSSSPSQALSFRGVFSLDAASQRAVQVWSGGSAVGRVVGSDEVGALYKFDSGRKEFVQMDSRRFTPTTDAFTLKRGATRRATAT